MAAFLAFFLVIGKLLEIQWRFSDFFCNYFYVLFVYHHLVNSLYWAFGLFLAASKKWHYNRGIKMGMLFVQTKVCSRKRCTFNHNRHFRPFLSTCIVAVVYMYLFFSLHALYFLVDVYGSFMVVTYNCYDETWLLFCFIIAV